MKLIPFLTLPAIAELIIVLLALNSKIDLIWATATSVLNFIVTLCAAWVVAVWCELEKEFNL